MKAIIIGAFTPTDYETWRAFHEAQLERVRHHGVISDRICRDVSNPSRIVVIDEVDDLERFMAFLTSEEGQAMMASSPIESPPDVFIVEEVEKPL